MPISLLEEALAKLEDYEMANVLAELNINLVSSIFYQWKIKSTISPERIESILVLLESELRNQVRSVLLHRSNSIGSMMNAIPFTVKESMAAGEVLALIRKEKKRYCRYLYLINDESVLCGVIPFKDIVLAEKNIVLSTIMTPIVYAFNSDDNIKSCFNDSNWKKWPTIPVVDKDHRLVGLMDLEILEKYMNSNKQSGQNSEMSLAGNAVGEIFQIGIGAVISTLMLPFEDREYHD